MKKKFSKASKFSSILGGNKKVLQRLKTISKMTASMHHARKKTIYMEVKFWGVPTGLSFVKAKDGFSLKLSGIKDTKKYCPSEGRSKLQFGDVLLSVDGDDVRGKLATEVKSAYRRMISFQGSHSTSECKYSVEF